MGLIAWLFPASVATSQSRYALASLVFIAGGFLGASAFTAFAKAQTTINPVHIDRASALVTSGIYRVTRNPMYVSLAAMVTTVALCLGSNWYLIFPSFFVLFTTRFQIIPEERAMRAKFGEDYNNYCNSVRRWI